MTTTERPKLLVMMHGITAAGKSTIAKSMEGEFRRIGASVLLLKTSAIKKERGWGGILRSDPRRHRVYELLRQRIASAFSSHNVVIVDGTHGERSWRQPLYDLCLRLDVALNVLYCVCGDEPEVRRRIAQRKKDHPDSPDSEAACFQHYRTEKVDLDELFADAFPANLAIQVAVLDTYREVANFPAVTPAELGVQWLRDIIMRAFRQQGEELVKMDGQ